MREITHEPLRRGASVSKELFGTLGHQPLKLLSQAFGGLTSLVSNPWARVSDVGLHTLCIPGEKSF